MIVYTNGLGRPVEPVTVERAVTLPPYTSEPLAGLLEPVTPGPVTVGTRVRLTGDAKFSQEHEAVVVDPAPRAPDGTLLVGFVEVTFPSYFTRTGRTVPLHSSSYTAVTPDVPVVSAYGPNAPNALHGYSGLFSAEATDALYVAEFAHARYTSAVASTVERATPPECTKPESLPLSRALRAPAAQRVGFSTLHDRLTGQ